MFRKSVRTSKEASDTAISVACLGGKGEYLLRHLQPENLGLLKRQMSKQLADLKEVNAQAKVIGPCIHRPGGAYIATVLTGTDGGRERKRPLESSQAA